MSASALRGGLIGCGFFAVNQMHGWREVEGGTVVAICDRGLERPRAVGEPSGSPAATRTPPRCFGWSGSTSWDVAATVGSHRAGDTLIQAETGAQGKVAVLATCTGLDKLRLRANLTPERLELDRSSLTPKTPPRPQILDTSSVGAWQLPEEQPVSGLLALGSYAIAFVS
jgi:hypothetical protein